MIPLRDNIPSKTFSYFNIFFIVINILIAVFMFFLSSYQYEQFIYTYGFTPAHFSYLTLFTSIFIHAGFIHLLSNMLFLWIFGDNVEDKLGHINYLFLYFFSGVVSVITHSLTDLSSGVPLVGASGAISGVLGAYFVFFPRARILTFVFLGWLATVVALPAYVFLGIWIVLQLLYGVTGLATQDLLGGVAWWAHIGGFITGYTWAKIFDKRRGVL